MFPWWAELILFGVFIVVGAGGSFFFLRKRPQYLKIDDLVKAEIRKRAGNI